MPTENLEIPENLTPEDVFVEYIDGLSNAQVRNDGELWSAAAALVPPLMVGRDLYKVIGEGANTRNVIRLILLSEMIAARARTGSTDYDLLSDIAKESTKEILRGMNLGWANPEDV